MGCMWRNSVWIVRQQGACAQRLKGVEHAGACCIIKTNPAPGQLCRTQDRNEGTMNGFLCVTMTAALRGEGMVRGPCYGRTAWVCALRNYSGMWGDMPKTKNLSCIQGNLTLLGCLWRNITIPSKGWAWKLHWMELMEVLCAGLRLLQEFNGGDKVFFSSSWRWMSSDSKSKICGFVHTGFKSSPYHVSAKRPKPRGTTLLYWLMNILTSVM